MTLLHHRWISKAAALALLVVVLGVLWTVAIAPGLAARELAVDALENAKKRQHSLNATITELSAEADALEDSGLGRALWTGARRGEVAARLQSMIGTLARDVQMPLRSIAPLQAADIADTSVLGLTVEAEGPLDRLVNFMRLVEDHEPPLIVTRANVRRVQGRGMGPQPSVWLRLELAAPVEIRAADER